MKVEEEKAAKKRAELEAKKKAEEEAKKAAEPAKKAEGANGGVNEGETKDTEMNDAEVLKAEGIDEEEGKK